MIAAPHVRHETVPILAPSEMMMVGGENGT
jgi:hypothetical protein